MSEENKKLTIEDIENEDEDLDAFAQALLNRKTEMLIFPENLEEMPEEEPPTVEEIRVKETALSEALDKLRQERGQPTITEEEEQYATPEQLVHNIVEETNKKKEEPKQPKRFKKVSFSKDGKDTAKVYKLPKTLTLDEKKRRIIVIVAAVVLAGAAAFGLYSWKVLVYNPNNISSAQQEEAYNKLVDYADEYSSGLMSDAEKLEILDLKADYDSLLQKQKDEINAYFREQTKDGKSAGRTFMDIYNEEMQMKKDAEEQTMPEYQALMDYLANWADKTEEERAQIVNYKETYDKLNDTLKYNVDSLMRETGDTTFPEAYNLYRVTGNTDETNEEKRAQWQAQLESLNAELATYQYYAQQLDANLQALKDAGMDTTEAQTAIDNNNQYMNELQQQIDTIQHQLEISQ